MLISEEIKSLALAILDLCLSEGISKSSVEKCIKYGIFKISSNTPNVSESKYQAINFLG